MLRAKGVGWGLVLSGAMFVIKSGMSVNADGSWALVGLVLVFFGAMVIWWSNSRT
jgi:hypothetical protein